MNAVNGSGRPLPPKIIQKLGAEYWASIPLEVIEHRISLASETDRVYYALIRCSYCWPHQSPFAVRPKLKEGGFAAWCARLHERIAKRRPIKRGDLIDEETDTDERNAPRPLTREDLCAITGLKKPNNVSRALQALRKENLLADGFPLYPVAKPSAVPSDPSGISTDTFAIAGLSINTDTLPTDFEACTRAREWLSDLSTRWKSELNALRTRFREELREGCTEHRILNNKERREKRTLPPSKPNEKATERHSQEVEELETWLAEFDAKHPSAPEVLRRLAALKGL
jgi:hypothetical protein